ncbi:MAG: hypothetical protein GY698_20850 [Actinomycetia bacterium]|nr:hypothetical protein [Actinomycetes bacterium]
MKLPDLNGIRIGQALTPVRIEEVRRLRAETYVDHGFLSPEEAGSVEHDKYDADALYFGALRGDHLVGGSRLVPRGPRGLFLLENFELNRQGHELVDSVGADLAEVSGLAVARGAGDRFGISAGLYRAMLHFSLTDLGVVHWVAVVDPALHRILARLLNIVVVEIGEPHELGHRHRRPVHIDLLRTIGHLRSHHPAEHAFFMGGLELDLTLSEPTMMPL